MRLAAVWVLLTISGLPQAVAGEADFEAILERIGLDRPGGSAPGPTARWSEGVLRGVGEGEILWTATCDPTPATAECGGLEEVVRDLRRTPLRRDLRIVLARDADGIGDWLVRLDPAARDRILAAIHHERAPTAGGPPIVLDLPTQHDRQRRSAPGWVVHAVLRGGDSVGRRPAVASDRLSVVAQLTLRATRSARVSAAQWLNAGGIPAVTLTDRPLLAPPDRAAVEAAPRSGSDTAAWAALSAAAIRRLDGLSGRPRDEDRYLVFGGQVWLPRGLYWIGFLVWVPMVLRGLPGSWRGASRRDRRRRGRAYLPGLAFRLLFLASLFATPVFAVPLLAPAALVSLLPPRRRRVVALQWVVGFLPLATLAAVVAIAVGRGLVIGAAPISATPMLIGATLAAFATSLSTRRAASPETP